LSATSRSRKARTILIMEPSGLSARDRRLRSNFRGDPPEGIM
jgi:hypothetical protein